MAPVARTYPARTTAWRRTRKSRAYAYAPPDGGTAPRILPTIHHQPRAATHLRHHHRVARLQHHRRHFAAQRVLVVRVDALLARSRLAQHVDAALLRELLEAAGAGDCLEDVDRPHQHLLAWTR